MSNLSRRLVLLAMAVEACAAWQPGVVGGRPMRPVRAPPVAMRQVVFKAEKCVRSEPFTPPPFTPPPSRSALCEWYASEEALKTLLTAADSSRRVGERASDGAQLWEVSTTIPFPGMAARSVTTSTLALSLTLSLIRPSSRSRGWPHAPCAPLAVRLKRLIIGSPDH